MATWIALLRGINVLGRKVVPMKARNWRTVGRLIEMARQDGG